MRVEVTRCDGPGCQHIKGDANKWVKAVVYRAPTIAAVSASGVISSPVIGEVESVKIGKLTPDESRYAQDFCSEECAQKVIGALLAKRD